jgi:hypothetical protein
MRKASRRNGLVGVFVLLLVLTVGANAAAAASIVATGATQSATCPSGMARVNITSYFHGPGAAIPVQGGTAAIDFTVAEGCNVELSLVSYKAPSDTFSADTASQQVLFDSATGMFGAGPHTLVVDLPNCFFQLDFVFGAPLATLGPAGSNNFYGAQGRLISAWNHGSGSCSAATPVTTDTGSTGSTGSTGNQTTVTAPTAPATTTTVIPAGPITWAPGFGPNGVVASVQTAPTTTSGTTGAVLGTQTAPVSVANLPSTSTDGGDNNGIRLLGIAAVALGLLLLRAGRPVQAESRLD